MKKDDPKEMIKWLEKQYPNGIDLTYINYNDVFEEMETVEKVLKGQDEDTFEWFFENQFESIATVQREYEEEHDIEELSETWQEIMREWLYEHDTSDPIKDMLKNTGDKLFFIETTDESESYQYADDQETWDKHVNDIIKKYAKTPEQEKEIKYVLGNQFYGAPISFYFHCSLTDMYDALGKEEKYITVHGAYFSTIDRGQGSNWLGENAVFDIQIDKDVFIENLMLDDNKSNGYGWNSIAGQTSYDTAGITVDNKRDKDILLIEPEMSVDMKREKELQENWDKTGTCTKGDMKWERHKGEKPYSNDYPCGNTCETCGTFWVD